jgi:hypothetical protein
MMYPKQVTASQFKPQASQFKAQALHFMKTGQQRIELKLSVMAHTCNSCTQETGAGESQVGDSLGYIMRQTLSLRKERKEKKK